MRWGGGVSFHRASDRRARGHVRSGGPRSVTDAQVAEVVTRTLETTPKGATHWSTRAMAQEMGLSQSTVPRIWRAFGLQPHRAEGFKLSTDPFFVDKVHDVVGLYLDPPERALVFCVGEKSQIQALDRSQPVLPRMPRGAAEDDLRLRAGRYHHVVRRPRRGVGQGDRLAVPPASRRRVQEVPHHFGQADAGRSRPSPGIGQLRHPQDSGDQDLAAGASTVPLCTSPRPGRPGAISSSGGSPN